MSISIIRVMRNVDAEHICGFPSHLPSLPSVVCQQSPEFVNTHTLHWQHAVLEAVQILPMNRRYELT